MGRRWILGFGVAGVMFGVGCGGQASSPITKPARNAVPSSQRRANAIAVILQRRVRHSQPVSYNANVGVEWLRNTPDGKTLRETTIAPLDYRPKGRAAGNDQYFRVDGHSLPKLRVRPILRSIATVHESWDAHAGPITATSRNGAISVSKITHIPSVVIHLSNGTRENVAIAQTSATP